MEYIRVRCSYCGGDGQYDPESQLVRCSYCSQTQTYTPKSKSGVMAGSSNNLVAMGNYALEVYDLSKALKYADKALEQDPKYYQAWLVRVKVLLRDSCLTRDAIASINKTIEYAPTQNKQQVSREVADSINKITQLYAYEYRKQGESDYHLLLRLTCGMRFKPKRGHLQFSPLNLDRYHIERFEVAHGIDTYNADTVVRLFYLYRLELSLQTASIYQVLSSSEGIERYNQYVDKHNNLVDLIANVCGSSHGNMKFSRIEMALKA